MFSFAGQAERAASVPHGEIVPVHEVGQHEFRLRVQLLGSVVRVEEIAVAEMSQRGVRPRGASDGLCSGSRIGPYVHQQLGGELDQRTHPGSDTREPH